MSLHLYASPQTGTAKPKVFKVIFTAGHENECVLTVIDLHYGKEGNM
jgi:hypothetical protein